MTSMSRSGSEIPADALRWALVHGVLRWWHISCISVVTGCFYVEPTWEPVDNNPPQILSPTPQDSTLVFQNSTETLRVVAFDEDGDNLVFFWDLPPFTAYSEDTRQESDGLWSSRLQIELDETLDGQQIELLIVDQSPLDPKSTSFVWDVVVP